MMYAILKDGNIDRMSWDKVRLYDIINRMSYTERKRRSVVDVSHYDKITIGMAVS